MNDKLCAAAAVLLTASGTALAQTPGAPQDAWSGKVSFGYLATTGNSEAVSVNAATEISYVQGRWTHTLNASALGSQDDVDTTAEAYQLGWKSDFQLSKYNYLFADLRWQKDKFSGIDQQSSTSLGYGRRLFATPKHVLAAELGIGAKRAELRTGDSQDETIVLGSLDYDWQISETAKFGQDVRVEAGDENTYLESVSSLNVKMFSNLGLVVSYTVRNNSDVPVGNEKTDTFTAISLEYVF